MPKWVFLRGFISMTKTKKILTVAIAVLLIVAAIFFAIWGRVAKKFDYADLDYAKYVTVNGSLIGLTLSDVDDTALTAPDADDVLAKLADDLYQFREKVKGEDGKETNDYVKYTESEIAAFDAVYVYYLGYDKATGAVVTDGAKMEKSTLLIPGAGSKHSFELKTIADALLGKKPVDSKYEQVKPIGEAEDAVVPPSSIVYIDYTWVRYNAAGEKAGNSGDDKTLVTKDVRVDLKNVPAIFPAGFGDALVGMTIDPEGSKDFTFENVTVTETVDGAEVTNTYKYVYTVTANFAINDLADSAEGDGWKPFTVEYTYAADSEAKGVYGDALAGKTVVFEFVAEYFHNVPDFTAEYSNAAADHVHSESEEDDHMESIFTHDKYLNFDAVAYFDEHHLLVEKDWDKAKSYADYAAYRTALVSELNLFIEESWNAQTDKKHETYVEYLEANGVLSEANWTAAVAFASFVEYMKPAYEAYSLETLTEEYNDDRMYIAAKIIWENHIVPNVIVTPPERALKLAYEELLDQYEYSYNEGKDTTGKIYRETYKNVGEYIEAACKDDMKKYEAEDWKTYLEKVTLESVSDTMRMYYLFELYEGEEGFDYEKVYSELYSQNLIYVLYGYLSVSQIEEAAKFDAVMTYLYEKANVTWKSASTSGDTGSAD